MNNVFIKDKSLNEVIELNDDQVIHYYMLNPKTINLNVFVQEGKKVDITMAILLKHDCQIDVSFDHEKNANSKFNLKVLTYDEGFINAKIISKVEQGITGVVTNQQSKILALDNLKSKVQPILKIASDDVLANHGVSIGNLNSDSIYYLMSKGLTKEEAKLKLMLGFLLGINPSDDVLDFYKGGIEDVSRRI